MGLDNSTDNEKAMTAEDDSSAVVRRASTSNRRRFTRNAIAGSAVLLSLGNRGAWGQVVNPNCMSVSTLNSFNPTRYPDRGFASQPPGGVNKDGHNPDLAQQIHDIARSTPPAPGGSDASYYLTDDVYRGSVTCQDAATGDICVIQRPLVGGGQCPAAARSTTLDTERTSVQQNLLY
jgi:hypothetical protein